MNSDLKVYNTLDGETVPFEPLNPPFVGMYVCGPTVYSEVHIGNVRTFTSFDIIYRYLLHLGYKVRYVRNITDVGHLLDNEEDKVAKRALLEQIEPMEVVQKYSVHFRKTMEVFNNLPPSIEPTATGHIMEQIEFIDKILKAGYAYESNGSVYFDVMAYHEHHDYGKLSGRKVEDLLSNTRDLDGQSDKRNALDFALWKNAEPQHIMKWNSPWGIGFPGWHLECSVMSTKYLGKRFDIHGGGMDLKFPHHECEIAQAQAGLEEEPVKYWLHTNMLTFNGKKMAKSEGTGVTPDEMLTGNHPLLTKGFSPMTIRFFMLQAHYRSTLDFSNEALLASEKGLQRLLEAMKIIKNLEVGLEDTFDVEGLKSKIYAAMNDDFNTPKVIAHLFDGVKWINSLNDKKGAITESSKNILDSLYQDFVSSVLGIEAEEDGSSLERIDGLMKLALDLRQQAKEAKDYSTADLIRDQLTELGFQIKDGKDGATYSVL
jgi:cysteinyl-tRNA synthetase